MRGKRHVLTPGVSLSIPLLLLTSFWLGGTPLYADDGWEVNLRVPSPLMEGQVYEAQLEVRPPSEIRDAYVKLSLPHAFRVVSGRTHFRGALPAESAFVLRATFRVSAMPSAPIMGRVLAYGHSGRVTFGRGKILYCKSLNGSIILSEQSPEAEEDEALATQTNGLAQSRNDITSLSEQRRRSVEERAVKRETLSGGAYEGWFESVEPLPENASITGWLEAGTAKAYQFGGHRADRIWLTAQSNALDIRLLLVKSDGTLVAEDDDGAGGLDARIPAQGVFELSSDDTYTIVVSSNHGSPSGSFRLQVQSFLHLQPAPGSVLPPADGAKAREAGGQSAADSVLVGKIVYNSPTGPAPVRLALVKLFADIPLAVDPELTTSQTDMNGDFSLNVPQANIRNTLYVVVLTRDVGLTIASVRDPLLGLDTVHEAESNHFTLPAATTATLGTWNVAGTGQNGPFLLFDAAVEGYLIATGVLGSTPPLIRVTYPIRKFLELFPDPTDPDAHYQNQEIFFASGYEDSPDVVLHEYGHFIAHVSGFLAPAGGKHSVPFYARVDPRLAWNEGWATFFAVAGQNARGRPDKRKFTSRHPNNLQDYDLDDGHNTNMIRDSVAGDDNEGSVQFVLWDLYDKFQDALPVARTTETISLGFKTVFDAARNGAVLYTSTGSVVVSAVDYFEKFYDGLLQQLSIRPDELAAFRALFLDQYIRWEVPPAPPTGPNFALAGGVLQLQWQAGGTNAVWYEIQQLPPGQTSFTILGTTTATVYPVPIVPTGTRFRVRAWSLNSGRFLAPFSSGFSQEVTYVSAPLPPVSPTIALSPASLAFVTDQGSNPPSQNVNVTNTGPGTLAIAASATTTAGGNWLVVSPTSGAAPTTLQVSVNSANLTAGTYSGTIAVASTSPGVTNSPQVVSVTLTVQPGGVGACCGPEPSLSVTVDPGFYIASSTIQAGGAEGYWEMSVEPQKDQRGGGFIFGGGIQEKGMTPYFAAFLLSSPQEVLIQLNPRLLPGGDASKFSACARLLDGRRQQIGTERCSTGFIEFRQTLPPDFYIIEVRTGALSPGAYFEFLLGERNLPAGLIVGGFLSSQVPGFIAFSVEQRQEVRIKAAGRCAFGAFAARCLQLTLYDSNRNIIAASNSAGGTAGFDLITAWGNGTLAFSGDGGPATAASLNPADAPTGHNIPVVVSIGGRGSNAARLAVR